MNQIDFDIQFMQPEIIIGLAILAAVALYQIILIVLKRRIKPYERLDSILTAPEQRFYKVLQSALGGRALIMSKVRIADLIKVRRTIARRNFWRHFSKISQKHIDFVLVDPRTFETLCLIELDDKSHARRNRVQRDQFVNRIMAQTGIPLYRFPVRRHYNAAEILNTLSPALSGAMP